MDLRDVWRLCAEHFPFVDHRRQFVSLRVEELGEGANSWDLHLVEGDGSTVLDDLLANSRKVLDSDGAREAAGAGTAQRFVAAVQRSVDTRMVVVSGDHVVETGRTPGLETPAEHRFVKAASTLDVVGVDGEMHDVVTHR